jgi:hypothetical protein
MSWGDVESFLARTHRLQPSSSAGLLALLETFVAANEDPGRSPNFRNQVNGVGNVVEIVVGKKGRNCGGKMIPSGGKSQCYEI